MSFALIVRKSLKPQRQDIFMRQLSIFLLFITLPQLRQWDTCSIGPSVNSTFLA
jgi:hypothetical protein